MEQTKPIDDEVVDFEVAKQKTKASRKTRKANKSIVFPDTSANKLVEGYSRPLEVCYVPESVAKPIPLRELSQLWLIPDGEITPALNKHKFLSTLVAMVGGEYYVKLSRNGRWSKKKRTFEVKSKLFNDWGGEKTQLNITKSTIETFLSEGEFPTLEGTAYIPGGGPYVDVGGQQLLNLYCEAQLSYPDFREIPDSTKLLIEMLVKNLLGHEEGCLEDWLLGVSAKEPSSIKWVFHWLASLYQRPGKALPTALWFVGKAQGVGKSLFANGLNTLLGSSNVKTVSAEEFKSEWTDFVDGYSVFLLDEVDFSSRVQAYNKSKRLIGNTYYSARKRGVGDREIPAVGNFVFTTNNTQPLALDPEDRRHTFFETKGREEAKGRAAKYYCLSDESKLEAWQGFAQLLAGIEIDDGLISTAFHTPIKARMIDANQDPFMVWLTSEFMEDYWKVGEFAPVQALSSNYIAWAQSNAFSGCATQSYFKSKMNDAISAGLVSEEFRKLTKAGKTRGHVRLDPAILSSAPPIGDCPTIAAFSDRPTKSKLKQRLKAKSY